MNKLFILLFILIFIIFYTYINLDKLIHERKVHPILLNFFNHPLKESYKYSCDIEYKKKNNLKAEYLGRGGAWLDTGSIEDFYNTSSFVSTLENRQGFKIACLEEIALKYNWIDKKGIQEAIKFYGNCEYSKYLKKIIS